MNLPTIVEYLPTSSGDRSHPDADLVPCHRVIGADGSLTGYGGGLERKRFLLDVEGRVYAGLPAEPAPAHCQLAMM